MCFYRFRCKNTRFIFLCPHLQQRTQSQGQISDVVTGLWRYSKRKEFFVLPSIRSICRTSKDIFIPFPMLLCRKKVKYRWEFGRNLRFHFETYHCASEKGNPLGASLTHICLFTSLRRDVVCKQTHRGECHVCNDLDATSVTHTSAFYGKSTAAITNLIAHNESLEYLVSYDTFFDRVRPVTSEQSRSTWPCPVRGGTFLPRL